MIIITATLIIKTFIISSCSVPRWLLCEGRPRLQVVEESHHKLMPQHIHHSHHDHDKRDHAAPKHIHRHDQNCNHGYHGRDQKI